MPVPKCPLNITYGRSWNIKFNAHSFSGCRVVAGRQAERHGVAKYPFASFFAKAPATNLKLRTLINCIVK